RDRLRDPAPDRPGAAVSQPLRPFGRPDGASPRRARAPRHVARAPRARAVRSGARRARRVGARLVAGDAHRSGARRLHAGSALQLARAARSRGHAVVRLGSANQRPPGVLHRRHGLSPRVRTHRRALRAVRRRAVADRRIRAQVVHAAGAHESRGGGAGVPRSGRRGSRNRHDSDALGHLQAHRRGHGRASHPSPGRVAGGGARAGAVLDAGARGDPGAVVRSGDSPRGLPASSFRGSRPIPFRRQRASSRPRGAVLALFRGLRPTAPPVARGPVGAARAAPAPAVPGRRTQERRRVAGRRTGSGDAVVAIHRHQHDEPAWERAEGGALAAVRAGAGGGAGWFVENHPELIRAAEFLVDEGGTIRADASGHIEYYGVGTTEKSPFWLDVTAQGTSGHGSRPTPDNPVHRLVRALNRIATWQTPLVVTPTVERYLHDLATIETDVARRAWLADVRAALKDSAAARALTADLTYNALLRNTISITGLKGSDKTNVIPPVASAALDVRLLPGQNPAAFLADLVRVVGDSAVTITPQGPNWPATESPTDTELFRAIVAAAHGRDPDALVTTPPLTGFTDSHYFRRLGIVSYGVSPFPLNQAE